ncbi:MAG: hypothetical protein WBO48_21265, partial [Candidatus Promineifilaceae bacterium]
HVYVSDEVLSAEITDAGPGFDLLTVKADGRLGLMGIRERVELLGGRFEVFSTPGYGTAVRANLDLPRPKESYD